MMRTRPRCLAHAAFEQVLHAERRRELLHFHLAAVGGKGSMAIDDGKPTELRNRDADLIRQAARNARGARVCAQECEWQHCDCGRSRNRKREPRPARSG